MTQRERLATLETQQEAHEREHHFLRELWAAHLEAIHARLANIEGALNSWRGELNGTRVNSVWAHRRVSMRDLGVSGGSMAVATLIWWLVRLLQTAAGA